MQTSTTTPAWSLVCANDASRIFSRGEKPPFDMMPEAIETGKAFVDMQRAMKALQEDVVVSITD